MLLWKSSGDKQMQNEQTYLVFERWKVSAIVREFDEISYHDFCVERFLLVDSVVV